MSFEPDGDQEQCFKIVESFLEQRGIDFERFRHLPLSKLEKTLSPVIILGRAGSGKTMILSQIVRTFEKIGIQNSFNDFDISSKKNKRSYTVIVPTNKAAQVLKVYGVRAVTLHRALYTPIYDPEFETITLWLSGNSEEPDNSILESTELQRARKFYKTHNSIPGALASVGIKGSDFLIGWKRREVPLDIGLIDECSMINQKQLADLKAVFKSLILFGDPAQLAPIDQNGEMSFDKIEFSKKLFLKSVHRQIKGNPILELSDFLADPTKTYADFERRMMSIAEIDDRIVVQGRVDTDLMPHSPVLVWRNNTRIRLIQGFRRAHNIPLNELQVGEPLICDGIELPLDHRKKRLDLEERGLIKGAQVIYLGPGKKDGFCRLHIKGQSDSKVTVASIIQLEMTGLEEPIIPTAATMGAVFIHGAATTIHKSQGSQWSDVQVFGPDIAASARLAIEESGVPLWKRLAYVGITRAQNRLFWVTKNRLSRPKKSLGLSSFKKIIENGD